MPVIKVTAATALPSVRQAIGEFAKAVKDAGALPGLEMVQQNLERLDSYCQGRSLDVEAVVVSPLEPALAGRVAGWIGAGVPAGPLQTRSGEPTLVELAGGAGLVPLRLRLRPIASSPAIPAGTPRPALLVLLVGNVTGLHPDNLASIERMLEDRPVAVLLAPSGEDAVKRLEERSQALAWATIRLDVGSLSEPALQARLAAPPWDATHDLLRAHSALAGVLSLNGVFELALQQQARDLRTKKAATQAKIGKSAPGLVKPSAPGADLVAEVKARIQRHAQEFERGASERLQDLLGLTGGTLARETEALLLSLDELDEKEGTTKIETRIPHSFELKLLKAVREKLARHCAADVVALNDLLRLLGQEIERTLAQNQGPPFVPQFSYLTEDRVRRLLDMTLGLQAQYRGELPHEGFSEYFASVRKYSMILVMAASMFGMSSMMRQYREYTVPLTVLLVLTGTYSVISSTRRARVENLEKELEAARNALRPDLKRIFAEMQKGWSAILLQHMNEQIAGVLADVDTAVKDHAARRGAEASPEKERLQRQLAQLEAAEKKLPLLTKARDTLQTSLEAMRSDLKPLFPRPGGAPGAPGAARPGVPAAAGAASAAQAAIEAARAKMEAVKAAAAAKAAPAAARPAAAAPKPAAAPAPKAAAAAPAQPSALQDAKARFEALKKQAEERKAAAAAAAAKPAEAGKPTPAEAAKPNALQDAKARFEAIKKQAEERKAAAAARAAGAAPATKPAVPPAASPPPAPAAPAPAAAPATAAPAVGESAAAPAPPADATGPKAQ
jgi:CheY-like chemotaxis protein